MSYGYRNRTAEDIVDLRFRWAEIKARKEQEDQAEAQAKNNGATTVPAPTASATQTFKITKM